MRNRSPWTTQGLLHTGCRSGAASSLRVADVVEPDGATLRATGAVDEKGGARREFTIDPLLGAALLGAVAANRGSAYVFPANRGIGRRPEAQNDAWFRALCARCAPPIEGPHVHVHALRRTCISLLLDHGNSLAHVSQWIGHRSTAMTQHYWEPGPGALNRHLHLPWLHAGAGGTVSAPVAGSAPRLVAYAPHGGDQDDDDDSDSEDSDAADRRLDVIEALLRRTRDLEARLASTQQT